MTPKLEHFDEDQKREIRAQVIHQLQPYRWRFWGVLTLVVIGFPVIYTQIQQSKTAAVCIATNRAHDWGQHLVLAATPLHPRAVKGAPQRPWTAEQKQAIIAARRALLATLPPKVPC